MTAVDDFHSTGRTSRRCNAFLTRRGFDATDALTVAVLADNGSIEILATVDHPQPRSASVVVFS